MKIFTLRTDTVIHTELENVNKFSFFFRWGALARGADELNLDGVFSEERGKAPVGGQRCDGPTHGSPPPEVVVGWVRHPRCPRYGKGRIGKVFASPRVVAAACHDDPRPCGDGDGGEEASDGWQHRQVPFPCRTGRLR